MEIKETVSNALANCSVRVEERKSLWAEIAPLFENAGASAVTRNLADRANDLKSKLDTKLRELSEKL